LNLSRIQVESDSSDYSSNSSSSDSDSTTNNDDDDSDSSDSDNDSDDSSSIDSTDDSDSDTSSSREQYHNDLQAYVYDSDQTDPEMPCMVTDDEDQDWESSSNTSDSDSNESDNNGSDNGHSMVATLNHNHPKPTTINRNGVDLSKVFAKNNIHYVYDRNASTVQFGHSDVAPPQLDTSISAGVFCNQSSTYTNVRINNDIVTNEANLYDPQRIEIISGNEDPTVPTVLFSHAAHIVTNGKCIISTINNVDYKEDNVEDIYFKNDVQVIRSKKQQWYLHVPIRYEDGKVIKTRVFADPGANKPCLDTDWAIKKFGSMIAKIQIANQVQVPGGYIKPKYCLWMTFPTKRGVLLKSQFLLVNNLPVKILLDINILRAFGYTFKEETPEIFRHSETDEIDLELPTYGEHLTNRMVNHNWFACVTQQKINQTKSEKLIGNENNKVRLYDKLYGCGELLYPRDNTFITSEGEGHQLNVVSLDDIEHRGDDENINLKIDDTTPNGDPSTIMNINMVPRNDENEIVNIDEIDEKELFKLEKDVKGVKKMVNKLNTQYHGILQTSFYRVLTLLPNQRFLSDDAENKRAAAMHKNEVLKFPDYSYLKKFPKLYGPRYNGLYDAVMKWIEKNRDIFAKRTYDRRTIKCEPARLGIAPEHRDKTMYAAQYPLSVLQRLYLINWTKENQENGFWFPVPRSRHCMPILLVPKRYSDGTIKLYRPAFDARIINKHCILMKCLIPTFQDFRSLHQQKGPTTMADLKNYFDCIPLNKQDWIYCTCLTPWGFYTMKHLTYGHKNAAPEAQKRTNDLALAIHNCLPYIDDLTIKHLFWHGTSQIIESLDRLALKCRTDTYTLNPTKFFPCCDESEGFGFKNTMIGQMISDSYRKKMLAVVKPKTKAEMKSFIGLIGYVIHHIWNSKRISYWLKDMEEAEDPLTKHKRLVWNKRGNLAFAQLRFLMTDTMNRILRHPTRDGRFAMKVDACCYGIGSVLWQLQLIDAVWKWVIVDMWSKVMPKQLRHSHSLVQEGYGAVASMEHWQFHLLRREFDFSTDNMPIAQIFGNAWKYLSPITQRQLIRLRARSNMFTFVSHHIAGIENPIADALSRFTVKLIEDDQKKAPEDREYPDVALEPIKSDDTKTPELTDEEKRIFDSIDTESKKLESHRNQLRKEAKMYSINLISNGYNFDPDEITVSERIDINQTKETKDKYYQYRDGVMAAWNDMLRNYVDSTYYLEREKMRDFIHENEKCLLIKTDDMMGFQEGLNLKEQMVNILRFTSKMSDETCNILEERVKREHCEHLAELKYVSSVMKEYHTINAIDEKYDYRDDLDILSSEDDLKVQEDTNIVQTRSKTKQKQQQERKSNGDTDDQIQDSQYFTTLNERFYDNRDYMESHENFMYELFGYRNKMEIVNFEKYKVYQRNDNSISLAMKLYNIRDRNQWDESDIAFLREWNFSLFNKLRNNQVKVLDGIVQIVEPNEITGKPEYKVVVPYFLIGKLMDYAHFSIQNHHFSYEYSLDKLEHRFWWGSIKRDIKWFTKRCISCQFVKGSKRHRAPMVTREPPNPRDHLFVDILGPIYEKYCILVMVDYATGFCMLEAIEGADAITVGKAIVDRWYRIFGAFRFFESDWGSEFNNQFVEYLTDILDCPTELAEPREHRSIGKVERVIGFLQSIFNHYNLLLENELTDDIDNFDRAWTRIKVLLPILQLALNQRKMRITGVSPNMQMFGMNMNDAIDIGRMKTLVETIKQDKQIKKTEYEYFMQLAETIEKISKVSKSSWEEVTYLSKEWYDKRHKISEKSVKRMKKKFKVGSKVLYYIGDKRVARGKWRHKWTGPWLVDRHIGDSSAIIADPTNGNQKRVTFDRLKQFNIIDFIKYRDLITFDEEYIQYQKNLLKTLSKYNVKFRDQKYELDYSKRFSKDKEKKDKEWRKRRRKERKRKRDEKREKKRRNRKS